MNKELQKLIEIPEFVPSRYGLSKKTSAKFLAELPSLQNQTYSNPTSLVAIGICIQCDIEHLSLQTTKKPVCKTCNKAIAIYE